MAQLYNIRSHRILTSPSFVEIIQNKFKRDSLSHRRRNMFSVLCTLDMHNIQEHREGNLYERELDSLFYIHTGKMTNVLYVHNCVRYVFHSRLRRRWPIE